MNFLKTSEGGGGYFRSKKFRCSFCGNFEGKTMFFFGKRGMGGGGGVAPIQKVCCKKVSETRAGGAPCIRIGVMKDNFVFDHFLHVSDYKNAQLG